MASELPWDVLKLLVSRFGIPHNAVRFKSVCSSWRSSTAANEQEVLFPRPGGSSAPPPHNAVRFKSVCSSWRSSTAANEQEVLFRGPGGSSSSAPTQFLGLMLPGDKADRRDFYSPLDDKVYKNLLRVPDEHLCRGNRDGWLITLSFSTKNICLLNPLSGDILHTITFPSLTSLHEPVFLYQDVSWKPHQNRSQFLSFVKRAVLSANPATSSGSTLTMTVIFGEDNRHLAYAREGGEAWLLVQEIDQYSPFEDRFGPYDDEDCIFGPYENTYSPYEDIIYYKDGFYAVNQIGTVFFVDINCSGHTVRVVVPPVPGEEYDLGITYLVESSVGDHELLLVARNRPGYETQFFRAYQLDLKNHTKTEITDLGDQCLFLGVNTSLSIPSPEKIRLNKNFIYYTDEYERNDIGQHELGIYNYERRKSSFEVAPQPMWLTLFNN